MKYSCEVIQDLLPLYYDGICSEESKKMVERHLLECNTCKEMMRKIKNNTVETDLHEERENVVSKFEREFKRKMTITGTCIAAIIAVPILVCLIVNLATGHALDWFFIVLTSLMVFGSLTVVPLLVNEKKFLWTIGSFTGSLLALLGTCCIYTGGDWFFVTVIPILFGLSVFFLPSVLKRLNLKGFLSRQKGLLAMTVDTILLYATVIVGVVYSMPVTLVNSTATNVSSALFIVTTNIIYPWIMFVIVRYLKFNKLVKAGICTILSGIILSFVGDLNNFVIDGVKGIAITKANLFRWNTDTLINANIYLLILLVGIIVGGILLAFGIIKNSKEKSTALES